MESYIDALRNGQGFDWICLHGHELSKTELASIAKELDYAISYWCRRHGEDELEIYNDAADSLAEQFIDDYTGKEDE